MPDSSGAWARSTPAQSSGGIKGDIGPAGAAPSNIIYVELGLQVLYKHPIHAADVSIVPVGRAFFALMPDEPRQRSSTRPLY